MMQGHPQGSSPDFGQTPFILVPNARWWLHCRDSRREKRCCQTRSVVKAKMVHSAGKKYTGTCRHRAQTGLRLPVSPVRRVDPKASGYHSQTPSLHPLSDFCGSKGPWSERCLQAIYLLIPITHVIIQAFLPVSVVPKYSVSLRKHIQNPCMIIIETNVYNKQNRSKIPLGT